MDIKELLVHAVESQASDLHLSAGLPPVLRIDGDIRRCDRPALQPEDIPALVYPTMSDAQVRQFERDYELDYSYALDGVARFRVNAFHHHRGMGAAFRVIPGAVPSLTQIGAPAVLEDIVAASGGLVLVTGPTGAGKSTTLAAIIGHLNRTVRGHIVTIEDPIEFVHAPDQCLIHQREAGRHTRGFHQALRAALREDPDIILVGELRDLETIRLALSAAETGHLVLATVHTRSAAKTVNRLIDVFGGDEKAMVRAQLAASLRAVISQILLKRVGGGRVAAFEIMIATPAICNLIREDKVAQMVSVIQTGQKAGMYTMDQSLMRLAREGIVAREEAGRYAENPASLGH